MNSNEWKISQLCQVAQIIMGQSPESKYYSEEEVGLPFLQGCADFQARFPKCSVFCSHQKKIAHPKSILFSVRAPVGRLNIADRQYIIGRGLAAITGKDIDQVYLEHYLIYEEPKFRNSSQGSTFEAINSLELSVWPIKFPKDIPEQSKIAEILSTVDRAIEQTEALIAKQQRIKTGLMQDLLTRGIDENGNIRSEETHQFKDSPLGRIPVEWEVSPANQLCLAVIDCKNRTPPITNEGHPVIRTPNVRNGEFKYDELVWTDNYSYKKWVARGIPRIGDVVITREAPFGEACQIPFDIHEPCLGQRMMMYQTDPSKLIAEYLVLSIYSESVQKRLLELAGGSTVGHIRVNDIRTLNIPYPKKVKEQENIVIALKEVIKKHNLLVRNIKKLQSLKTALMQDLLTGNVRVTPLLGEETESV